MVEAVMYYLLMFLGVIGVAVILAMSPLVIRLLEYLFPTAESDRPSAKTANPQSVERSEMHDEIRRLTAALETDRRGSGRMKG
jgi:hypothetical protein